MPPTRIAAPQNPKEKLHALSEAALTVNATFLALPAPNVAQLDAQVDVLTRQVSNLIRLTVGILDGSAS